MKHYTFITYLFQSLGFLLMIMSLAFPEAAELLGLSGITMAAVPVAGGTQSVGAIDTQDPEYLQEDISKIITRIEPNDYPFDTLTRFLGNERPARNMRIQFEEFEYHKRDGVITAAEAVGGEDHKKVLTLQGNIEQFGMEETIMIPEIEIEVDGKLQELVLKVIDRDASAKKLTVQTLAQDSEGFLDMPTITPGDGLPVYRLAPNVSEMTAQVNPKAMIPTREWNYAQILMATISQSKLMKKMRAKSEFKTFTENQRQSLKDFRSSCEYATKFGVRSTGFDSDGEQWWSMNGFTRYLDQTINYTKGNMSEAGFIDWTRTLFANRNGSKQRHLIADSYLVADILKVPSVQKQMDATKVDVVRGIRCSRIESNFGTLLITHDNSLDELNYRHYGLVVDPKNLRRRVVEEMEIKTLEVDKPGLKRAEMKRILETFSIEVRHAETHAIIRGNDPD